MELIHLIVSVGALKIALGEEQQGRLLSFKNNFHHSEALKVSQVFNRSNKEQSSSVSVDFGSDRMRLNGWMMMHVSSAPLFSLCARSMTIKLDINLAESGGDDTKSAFEEDPTNVTLCELFFDILFWFLKNPLLCRNKK